MGVHHSRYTVRFQGDMKEICIIEAEAPVDADDLRKFIAKTRRVFDLAEDAVVRVIELRQVTERHEITSEILVKEIVDAVGYRQNLIRRILDGSKSGETNPLESYHAIRNVFDMNAYQSDSYEEQAG